MVVLMRTHLRALKCYAFLPSRVTTWIGGKGLEGSMTVALAFLHYSFAEGFRHGLGLGMYLELFVDISKVE